MYYFLLILFLVPMPLFALRAQIDTAPRGEEYVHQLRIDTQGEFINLVEGSLMLTHPVRRVETGGSIIQLWIEKPTISESSVSFAGMIPGGFKGVASAGGLAAPGVVLSLVTDSDSSPISGAELNAYLHDGKGTKKRIVFEVIHATTSPLQVDTTPPTLSTAVIEPASTSSPALLVVDGSDEDTGIARLELSMDGVTWNEFSSPYALGDAVAKTIRVRLFDHEGNFREVTIQQDAVATSYEYVLLAIIAAGIALVIRIVWRRRTRV